MGVNHSHTATQTFVYNGITTIHHETITRNMFCFTMVYLRESDNGERKVIVDKKGKNRFRVRNIYDNETKKDEKFYSKDELIKLLTECELSEHLKFMCKYLQNSNI